ncbi:MAG: hypothetical protein N2645_07810 [Clostridia bacterium]|nr:hypothetical protein [Clostridia bacterium]
MIRKSTVILLLVITIGFLSACGSKGENPADIESGGEEEFNRQGQFNNRADLTGEVASVEGNTITLKVIEIPQFRNDRENRTPRPDRTPGAFRTPGARGGEGPAGNRQRLQGTPNYTGETKKITLPEGVHITTMVRGENGVQENEVDIKTVKSGEILQVWYKDQNQNEIERVRIGMGMGMRNNRG